MTNTYKKQLASIFWDDMISHPTAEKVQELLIKAYPEMGETDLIKEFGTVMWPSRVPLMIYQKLGVKSVIDLYEHIKSLEPGLLLAGEEDSGPGYYYFESVGSSLQMISRVLTEDLTKGRVSENDFSRLYGLTNTFSLYAQNEVVHSHAFLREQVLHPIFRAGYYDLFETLFDDMIRARKLEMPLPDMVAISLFMGASLIDPLLKGHSSLFRKIQNALLREGKKNSLSANNLTHEFWRKSGEFITELEKISDPDIWRHTLNSMQNEFSINHLVPFKESAKNGSLLHGINGYIATLKTAKSAGFSLEDSDLKAFVNWVDRISKSLGVNWSRSIPEQQRNDMHELFKDVNKKDMIGRKSSQALIESLHILMPRGRWMDHSREKYRADVLINQMNF